MQNSANSKNKRPNEISYLIAFALGMAFLWLSGHAAISFGASHPGVNYLVNFIISGLIYGLGAGLTVYFLAGRKLIPSIICGLTAAVLAPVLAIGIGKIASNYVSSKQDLGILTFVLYLIFGGLYPVLLAVGSRFLRRRHFDVPAQ